MRKGIKIFSLLLVLFSILMIAACGIKSYEVRFFDHDGVLIQTDMVKKGSDALPPSDPDNKDGYHFIGWDKEFTNVSSELDVNALYEINSYTVTYKDYDGSVLKTELVTYGSDSTPPVDPDNREGYLFSHWDKGFNDIRSDLTITAVYADLSGNYYNVYFKDYDGTNLSVNSVPHGGNAVAPADPVREGYTFTGWDKAFINITSELTVTALYEIKTYTVTFKDHDGTVLKTQTVNHGSNAIAPAEPDNKDGFMFSNWDKAFNNVTSNLEVLAVYVVDDGQGNTFTVIFTDYDGTVLKTVEVDYGNDAVAPVDPARVGYTFTGWDKGYTNVKKDLTIVALYEINTYTVTFVDYDDTVLKIVVVEYGNSATAPDSPDNKEDYTFSHWDKSFNNITSNLEVKAVYILAGGGEVLHNVTFVDWDNSEIYFVKVADGEDAIAPADPMRIGYNFIGWNVGYTNVTSNLVVKALYEVITYTVTFVDYDTTVLKTQSVIYGGNAEAPIAPNNKVGYHFTSWDKGFNNIFEDLIVIALYEINVYVVTFVDYDGTELKTMNVNHGEDAIAPEDPEREGYTFYIWNRGFTNVTSILHITATYDINQYTVLFIDFTGGVGRTQIVAHGDDATPLEDISPRWKLLGFDKDYTNITSDITITGIYELHEYTVTFLDHDGTVLRTLIKNYGDEVNPPQAPDNKVGHFFKDWDKDDYEYIKGDTVITAVYQPFSYTVTFYNHDSTVITTGTYPYGSSAVAPVTYKEKVGHHFVGWDKDFSNITEKTDVYAQFEKDSFTVIFYDYGFVKLKEIEVLYEEAAIAPNDPERVGFIFTGWDKDFDSITEETFVYAVYEIITFTITFDTLGEGEIEPLIVNFGERPVMPEAPTKVGYDFYRWMDGEIPFSTQMEIYKDYNLTATYNIKKFTITWLHEDGSQLTKSFDVEYGEVPIFDGMTPIKEGYIFDEWDPVVTTATEDTSYTATFKRFYPEKYVLATDEDFNGNADGYFVYVGDEDYVIIPEYIKGKKVTRVSYYNGSVVQSYMFNGKPLIKGVAFEKEENITDMSYLFYNNLSQLLELDYLYTNTVTRMDGMFKNTKSEYLDLSNFDTSNVLSMYHMFYGSKAFSLNLSSFDTSKTYDMYEMFNFSMAEVINLTGFNTSNVMSFYNMFANTEALTLDLSWFNTSNVINMSNMFANAKATTIDVSNFDTSKVTSMSHMFTNTKATSINTLSFNTSSVLNMEHMFSGSKFNTLNLNHFNTSSVTNMANMFNDAAATAIHITNFDTSNVTTMFNMFSNTKALTLNLHGFNTSSVTNMSYMFYFSIAEEIILDTFNTSNVTTMNRMFLYSNVQDIDISHFNTSSVTDMTSMFAYSEALTINLTGLDVSNVKFMGSMFSYSMATTIVGLEGLTTTSVENIEGMFYNSQVEEIILTNFDTSKITNMSTVFYYAQATVIDVTSFDTSLVTTMFKMFAGTKADLDLTSFDTTNVKSMSDMFSGAYMNVLDLSSFDLTNTTNMGNMFLFANINIGYARTVEDMNKLNQRLNIFILKP